MAAALMLTGLASCSGGSGKGLLPNVSGDGRICFGNAVATAHVDQRTPNEAESLQAILTLFFGWLERKMDYFRV